MSWGRGRLRKKSTWQGVLSTILTGLLIFFLLSILSFLSLKLKKLKRCLLWFGIMIHLFKIYSFIHSFIHLTPLCIVHCLEGSEGSKE